MTDSVFEDAVLATVPQLNIFSKPLIQTAVEKVHFVEYQSVNQIATQDAPITFHLGGDSQDYLDLSRGRLFVRVKLVKEDDTSVPAAEKPAPVNLVLHSLFSQVEVCISGKNLSIANNCHPYKAYLKTVLTTSEDAKNSLLSTQGYNGDSGNLDKVTSNPSALERARIFGQSALVELEGPLLEDCLQLKKFLPNNTGVRLKLYPSRPQFHVITEEDDKKYKLKIVDISYKACYVSVNPSIIAAHAKVMEKANAIYEYTKVDIKTHTVSSGSSGFTIDNMFNGECPTKVFCFLVDSAGFHGDYKKNPFNLIGANLSSIELSANGVAVPARSMPLTFDSEGRGVTQAVARLFDTIGASDNPSFGNSVNCKSFASGYAIYAFPVYGSGAHDLQVKRTANIRLQASFSTALTKAITVCVYAEFPTFFELEASRNVVTH